MFVASLLIFYLYIFLNCYVHHRNLHSFPTRRSSDLYRICRCGGCHRLRLLSLKELTQGGEGPDPVAIDRSEEHTSELQSRPHLVCRLLLEKKKFISILQPTDK